MISEVILWVIGLILFFPFLRNSGAMGMFYLFGAFTAIFIVRNVIAPWIRQRNSRKPGASLRFNVYVAVILCLALIIAVAIFKKIEEYFHYDPPKPMEGSTGQVDVLVFDSTAERLASGGLEPMVRVWNPIESKHIRNLPAEGQSYYAGYPYLFTVVVYSPDGKLLATGSADKSVRVWNTQNNKLETQLFCHDKPVRALAFSADGHWFASGGDDAVICVWHISGSEWKRVKVIGQADKGHSARITALAFSPDSKYLASASADMFVKVWQTDNFSWKWTSNAHDQGVFAIAFTQDGKTILSVTDKGALRRWTPEEKGANIQQEFYKDKPETITAVAFNKNATLVAISGLDRYIRVYDTNPGSPPPPADRPKVNLDRQSENVTALAFHPTDDKLVSAGKDNLIKYWDLRTAKVIRSINLHNAEVKGVAFHPQGNVLASIGADKLIRFWQPEDNKTPDPINGTTEGIVKLAFSSDSSNLFSASRDGYVRMWKLENGMMEAEYLWNPNLITCLAVRPNQVETVVVGNAKGNFRIMSPSGVFAEIHAYDDPITSIAYTPDGSYFVTASIDKPLRVWDASGKSIGEIKGLGGRITNLIFSSDGKTLVGASDNHKTVLWRFADPKVITNTVAVPLPASGLMTAMVFSQDSQILVTGDNSGNIQLWDVSSGRFLESLRKYPYPVMALGVDKENTVYAAGLTPEKPNIQIWNVGNIQEGLSQLNLSSIIKFLVGNETGKVFWSLLGGFVISASFVLLLIAAYSAVAARSLYMQYPGFRFGQAFQAVMSVTLGTHKIQQRVRNGELVDMHGAAGSLAALGGPGVLIVEEGNVAILMQSGRITRVVGMGITWLDYFERVHMAVPLSPQSGKFSVKDIATLDGIILREIEFSVRYRIDPGNQTSTSGAAYPYDEKLIREKIGSPEGGNWRWNPQGALDAAARDFIGQLRFEDMFAISGETRQQLISDIQNRLSEYAQNAGVRVLSVSIGSVRLPDEIKQALEEKKLAELNRQKAIIEAEAKKETLTRQGEGEALALRMKQREKIEMREKMLRDIVAPLQAAGGDKEMLEKFLRLFERFLDSLDKSNSD